MNKTRGFSLIELLVVMVILAVAAAGVSTAVNPQGSTAKQINRQGDILFAQMQFAFDEALFLDKPLGVVIDQDPDDLDASRQYAWYIYDQKEWQKTEEPLGEFELPEQMTWDINVEQASLEDSLDDLLKEDEITPIMVFYPSGEVTEFSVDIRLSDEEVEGDLDAALEIYTIALDETGELASYRVGQERPE